MYWFYQHCLQIIYNQFFVVRTLIDQPLKIHQKFLHTICSDCTQYNMGHSIHTSQSMVRIHSYTEDNDHSHQFQDILHQWNSTLHLSASIRCCIGCKLFLTCSKDNLIDFHNIFQLQDQDGILLHRSSTEINFKPSYSDNFKLLRCNFFPVKSGLL